MGFQEVEVREFTQVWQLRDADETIAIMCTGTVRTGALLTARSPADLAAIHAAVRTVCDAYHHYGGIGVPMPAVLAIGPRLIGA